MALFILYGLAGFPPTHEIAVEMRAAVKSALADGKFKMELMWPCVPNLEEIKVGCMMLSLFVNPRVDIL